MPQSNSQSPDNQTDVYKSEKKSDISQKELEDVVAKANSKEKKP